MAPGLPCLRHCPRTLNESPGPLNKSEQPVQFLIIILL